MPAISNTTIARAAGAILGIALAAALLVTSRPAAMPASLPANAEFTVGMTGELEVTPAATEPVLTARLQPADRVTESFEVRNQTGETLDVGFAARAASHELDGLLNVRLVADSRTMADTTLQGLRQGTTTPIVLASGEAATLRLTASIPDDVVDGYEGRIADITLQPVINGKVVR
jgi:hypothetical protein